MSSFNKIKTKIKRPLIEVYRNLHDFFLPGFSLKEKIELKFWKTRYERGALSNNAYYKEFYLDYFGLTMDDYSGKAILDIGCGPRGSLEWVTNGKETVGLDPLAEEYLNLGGNAHTMKYVKGIAEDIPFDDGYFDIVCSFNSLDHVDDYKKAISEISRVIKKGGYFLLIVDIYPYKTVAEPSPLPWNVLNSFKPEFVIEDMFQIEKEVNNVYQSVKIGKPFNHNDPKIRFGILTGKLKKVNEKSNENFSS